jgi:hypothetical protein
MFYAYRGGKYRISGKAWRKLEAAETDAGIRQSGARQEAVALANLANPQCPVEERLARLEAAITEIRRILVIMAEGVKNLDRFFDDTIK